jgi:acyl-coenzyme A thioesterase PaaI-like protein|tara:strand:- start:1665 stop:2138 length:474 start_codon:yes stop_codon:yes gene_type:complete
MISRALKTNRLIRLFGVTKVPMIWYCRPKVIEHNDEKIEIQIPLKRRTKNHLGSMYFGVLAVGADITGGFLAMDPIQDSGRNIALIFKDFKADFLKRPEGDVHFICKDGLAIKELVDKVTHSTERHNYKLNIEAIVPSISTEVVARFELTLSLKDKT